MTEIPPARFNHCMTYIESTGNVLLFGGYTVGGIMLNDTWLYDPVANEWHSIEESWTFSEYDLPAARIGSGIVYDSVSEACYLLGGRNSERNLIDFWKFDPDTAGSECPWQVIKGPPNEMEPRYNFGMCVDEQRNKIIVYGGKSSLNDTWEYRISEDSWYNKECEVMPPDMNRMVMSYDRSTHRILLFGGINTLSEDDESATERVQYDQTWEYFYEIPTWRLVETLPHPSARYSSGMAFDSHFGGHILFGGVSSVCLDDLWKYHSDPIPPSATPTSTSSIPTSTPAGPYPPTMTPTPDLTYTPIQSPSPVPPSTSTAFPTALPGFPTHTPSPYPTCTPSPTDTERPAPSPTCQYPATPCIVRACGPEYYHIQQSRIGLKGSDAGVWFWAYPPIFPYDCPCHMEENLDGFIIPDSCYAPNYNGLYFYVDPEIDCAENPITYSAYVHLSMWNGLCGEDVETYAHWFINESLTIIEYHYTGVENPFGDPADHVILDRNGFGYVKRRIEPDPGDWYNPRESVWIADFNGGGVDQFCCYGYEHSNGMMVSDNICLHKPVPGSMDTPCGCLEVTDQTELLYPDCYIGWVDIIDASAANPQYAPALETVMLDYEGKANVKVRLHISEYAYVPEKVDLVCRAADESEVVIPQIAFNGGYYARCRTTPPICIQRTVAKKGENQEDGSGRDTPTPTPEESCSNAMEVARIEPHLNGLETWQVNTMYCTISPILDRIHVNQELDVEIGIEGAESLEATVTIERVLGSAGDAQFMDGSHSKSVTLPATLRIKGVQNSDLYNNLVLKVVYGSKEIGSEEFYVSTLPTNFQFFIRSPSQCIEGLVYIPFPVDDWVTAYVFQTEIQYESESSNREDLNEVEIREARKVIRKDIIFGDPDAVEVTLYTDPLNAVATPFGSDCYKRNDNINYFQKFLAIPIESSGTRVSEIWFEAKRVGIPNSQWEIVSVPTYIHTREVVYTPPPPVGTETPSPMPGVNANLTISSSNLPDQGCTFLLPTAYADMPTTTPTPLVCFN